MFTEFNNREVAKKNAEFITSENLRRFVAGRVKEYCGDGALRVFDGACGSGQLEQFISVREMYGVDIQSQPLTHLAGNYPTAVVTAVNDNFFNVIDAVPCDFDCVVMNPPFSLKYKDESEDIREKITAMMPYKKVSGNLDDAFYVMAGMKARFSFFLAFPGIGYRNTEKGMREWFGNRVAEITEVRNGFADTGINVLFFVTDNEKTDDSVRVSTLDASSASLTQENVGIQRITTDTWNRPEIPVEKEVTDIVQVTGELLVMQTARRKREDELNAFVWTLMSSGEREGVSRLLSGHGLFFEPSTGIVRPV
ncbi:TPA: SAM-dependent DNA methyltransferase [Escherichia coli]|nr:SAM-dependent DNA methyltransferase [Escherichia coli]